MGQITAEKHTGVSRSLIRPPFVRDNAILAVGYFIAGYVGISLAVPPGYATIIWPASGLALCALLLRGSRMWPGVWLGSFAFNAIRSFDNSVAFDHSWLPIAIAAAIGAGASIQAFAGLWLARRFTHGIELTHILRVASGALAVLILPCFIAPTVGVGALFASGVVGPELVLRNWLTWFSGDVLGVLLILPILLLSNLSPVPVRWRGRSLQGSSSLVAISLSSTLLLTFYVWQFITEREYRQAEENLTEIAVITDEALRHRLQIYQRALESGAAFVTVKGSVTPSEWSEYVTRLNIERAYPGMRGVGLFEEVADENLPAFREQFTREFGERFEVHPRVQREQHFIINRIEPLASNLAALGLDLAFEEGRRDAIELSKNTRDPLLTRPIVLVQDAKQGAGFLLVNPILDGAGQPSGQWVYSPLVADELFGGLTFQQGTDFALEVFHGEEFNADALLYAAGDVNYNSNFEFQKTITLAGQPFTLHWSSLAPFENRSVSSAPALTLVSGLAITVLLGILLLIFIKRESHVVREVEEATRELEEQNRMLELAEATAHIGSWHLDLTTKEIRWSDEVHRLHGLALGNTPTLEKAIEFYHPDDRRIVEQSIETAVATHQPHQFAARLVSDSGELRHVEVRGRVELNEEGQPSAIIGVIIDRTDEILMRERLLETIEDARAADKAKSSFLANMSHEIRTPMNGVIGFTELAIAEEKDPEQKGRLKMIADSSNAMLRLLNDLLDFAKIEANQMGIVKEPTDLRHTLRSCHRLMEPVAKSNKIDFLLEIAPDIPLYILSDKMRLHQIILNLVGNALKFTKFGEVKISVSSERCLSYRKSILLISVKDTGIGIPADRLQGIFDKFTQADDATARQYGGTGLGLPISAELASLMGGELRVESELGRGSTFVLSLPLEESSEAMQDLPVTKKLVENCGHDARLRILVAEDNPINQKLTMAMVEKAGHDCVLASNGREAVESALEASREGKPYDLVLMDMQMPELDGLEAAQAIREAGIDAKTLPILAVTANAYADDVQRCIEAGMQAHLAKPLRFNPLCAAISTWSLHLQNANEITEGAFEQETDPPLRSIFAGRIRAAVATIDAIITRDTITDEKMQEVTSVLHQIAGVAGNFRQEPLSEFCRTSEKNLLSVKGHSECLTILRAIRERLASVMITQSAN